VSTLHATWFVSFCNVVSGEYITVFMFTYIDLFCSLAVLDPRVGHAMDVLSPFISVLCHSVAAAKVWNGLPSDVTSASSLSVFKNRLKTYLFRRCYETV